jgi:NADH:ubiquinone oxidoreductase subunit 2 (subunit N)
MPKILLLFLLIKLYFYFFFFELRLNIFFYLLGIISIIIGGFNAMYQIKIKRFLAYSTIANIGFIIIGYSIFSIEGMFASLLYLLCYIFSVMLFFILLLFYKKNKNIEFHKLFELSFLNYN